MEWEDKEESNEDPEAEEETSKLSIEAQEVVGAEISDSELQSDSVIGKNRFFYFENYINIICHITFINHRQQF